MKASGGCHCGAVRFEVLTTSPQELVDCNCSICSLSGYLHLFIAHGDFNLLSGKDDLSTYRYGTKTAEHYFCKHCGVKSFYQPKSHPDCYSVHFKALDEGHKIGFTVKAFDGKNWNGGAFKLDD